MRPVTCCALFVWIAITAACGPSTSGGGDDVVAECAAGDVRCNGAVLQTCEEGVFANAETAGYCDGGNSLACSEGGTLVETHCDPVQGVTCSASGLCDGACSLLALGESYVGCDYWPTVTGNMVSRLYDFAVAVSNTTDTPAQVTIEGGALSAADVFMVAANSVAIRRLPWVPALKLCVGDSWSNCIGPPASPPHPNSARANGGAYHLRSNVPITVYQFNPLDYRKVGVPENSYSNDASLLFPTNAWRKAYYATTWQQTANLSPSLIAITAYQDGTAVTITTTSNTTAEGGAPPFTAGVPQMLSLGKGDVIELGTVFGDMTGSFVTSDKPVQVIAAHYCAKVPEGVDYCDHLEESMFPIDALSNRYLINAPAVTTIPNGKEQVVRIVATQADTALTYNPPQANAPTTIARPGDFAEISRQAASYMITANHKVLVSQIMEGSTAGGNTGDPAMALAVPVEQYRSAYLFHAPTNYQTNYVDITAPVGATVTLDGTVVTNFASIGSTGYALARITPLGPGPGNDGNHSISGSMPFGISVYGYGMDTSYWYPGGLDLELVPVGHLVQPSPENPRVLP